jgi:hypothetical protein
MPEHSISRVLFPEAVTRIRAMTIHLAPTLPMRSSGLPGNLGRTALKRSPIRPCSRWGLPSSRRHRGTGELLPHRFTLTRKNCFSRAVYFLWHFPSRHRDWGLPSTLSCGARTFLPLPKASSGHSSYSDIPDCRHRPRVSSYPPKPFESIPYPPSK